MKDLETPRGLGDRGDGSCAWKPGQDTKALVGGKGLCHVLPKALSTVSAVGLGVGCLLLLGLISAVGWSVGWFWGLALGITAS